MKTINVVGHSFYDIVLYLAALLGELGEQVTVADETEGFRLYDFLPDVRGMNGLGVTELRGVKYVKSRSVPAEGEVKYRFICRNAEQYMTLEDCAPDITDRNSDDEWLFVTDEDARHATDTERVYEAVRAADNGECTHTVMRVIRGSTGVTKNLYSGMLQGGKEGLFILPYIERDRRAELYLAVRDDISFRPVSERFSSVLEKLVYILRPGTKVAEFERAYRSVLKGGI